MPSPPSTTPPWTPLTILMVCMLPSGCAISPHVTALNLCTPPNKDTDTGYPPPCWGAFFVPYAHDPVSPVPKPWFPRLPLPPPEVFPPFLDQFPNKGSCASPPPDTCRFLQEFPGFFFLPNFFRFTPLWFARMESFYPNSQSRHFFPEAAGTIFRLFFFIKECVCCLLANPPHQTHTAPPLFPP